MATKMNISIPSPLKKWVDNQATQNGYASANEFVSDVLRREQILAEREKLGEILTDCLNSGTRGRPMTPKDWQRIRERGLRLAQSRRKK